jgi:hypothetical protein
MWHHDRLSGLEVRRDFSNLVRLPCQQKVLAAATGTELRPTDGNVNRSCVKPAKIGAADTLSEFKPPHRLRDIGSGDPADATWSI